MADWTEEYRPNSLSELRGNDKACKQLREWATEWPENDRAVILHGSPGVGKTSAAHAVAAELGWEPIELNASDQRTAAIIDRVAGEAAASATLTGGDRRRLVILDEADNLHGNVDRGGAGAMTRLVKETRQPVVLIANEYYEMSNGLRDACADIEFRDISSRSIVPVLRDICRKEEIEFDEAALERIAAATSGDLRSAINDLQAIAERTDRLTVDDVVTGERDESTGIFPFLDTVLKEAQPEDAIQAAYAVDETPDDTLAWVEDNVPKEYDGLELARAYRSLGNADRWLGRVLATQNYQFWRYATDNIAGGVAAARGGEKGGWTRYGPPRYWSHLGRSRTTRDRRDRIARRIAEAGRMSTASARREVLPYLSAMTHHCHNRDLTVSMAATYDLDEDHVAFVTGSGPDTNKVAQIVEDAQERREPSIASTTSESTPPSDGLSDPAADRSGSTTSTEEPDEDTDTDTDSDPDTEDAKGETGSEADEAPSESSEDQTGLADFM